MIDVERKTQNRVIQYEKACFPAAEFSIDLKANFVHYAYNPDKAARLFGALENIYESIGYKIEEVDEEFMNRYLDEAREAIGEEKFETEHRQGRRMSLPEAISLAREG